jgi:hypothetical protein
MAPLMHQDSCSADLGQLRLLSMPPGLCREAATAALQEVLANLPFFAVVSARTAVLLVLLPSTL